ncbi:MAG TPA: SNF2-related protein [Candidatus Sulfotelmatobacter sp.]|nr:SNF2-related protein [Candidatus Sulfotelmatobacter sp.]
MTPYGLWRSRLPAQIGTWFARDLTRDALALVEGGRVALRSVEPNRIEATVKDRVPVQTTVEWATGTGPQALRSVCSCGATGVCQHVVATLEVVRTAEDVGAPPPVEEAEVDLSWIPDADPESGRPRARAVWPVLAVTNGGTLSGSLYLDTPRLRGVIRDADAILAMMDQTPADDWDEVDRGLLRDDAVQEAFGARASAKALARALFRLARHPRLRFDDDPSANRHPSELPPFAVDPRGTRLRAARAGGSFVPVVENHDGAAVALAGALVLDGPPPWLIAERTAYLLDGAFDPRKVILAARTAAEAAPDEERQPTTRTIARVAPFLTAAERAALNVDDAARPALLVRAGWRDGALVARLAFADRATGAYAPFSSHGAVTSSDGRFVRWAPDVARGFARRFLESGFVPRGSDVFALHDPDRAAEIVRTTWTAWDDVEVRLDESLASLLGNGAIDVSISASAVEGAGDWFDLDVAVFVGDGEPLTREELRALLGAKGRYAEVRGKLVDIADLRSRQNLLSELTDRRRTGLAALVAMRDELHEAFGEVVLPEEVERIRERLRTFEGIEEVPIPEALDGHLRDYQRRGLDFLSYLSSFRFGGILADEMGLGKSIAVHQRVVTPRGLRIFGELKVGDQIMGRDGLPHTVIGVYPQGVLPAYRVTFSDGSSTLASDDHLWAVNSAVRKNRGLPYRVLTTREIRERLHDAAGNARHYIPIADPMHFGQSPELPIEPYLLGALLADGSLKRKSRLMLTTADRALSGECQELLPTGTELVLRDRYDYRIKSTIPRQHALWSAIEELGLRGFGSSMKFVPSVYKTASISDRLALLQGLLDTGGSTSDNHVEFTTVSDQLAQDVAWLVQSLGGVARMGYKAEPRDVYKGEQRIGKPSYRVGISLPPEYPPFRLARKLSTYTPRTKYLPTRAIVKVEYQEDCEMMCIAVDAPDQLFLVDDFIVTHNTVQVIAHLLRRKENEGEVPVLVIAPTSVTHTWENELKKFAPSVRALRLQSGSDRAAKYETIHDYDVVITSYALARLDAQQLERFRFRTLVLDEAQNAKNPASQIARVVRGLQADHRLALTGTPVENSLRDLWAIFGFVEPGLLGSETSFRRRFELPIADGDERAAIVLRSRLEPFLLRRTKEDVARELPERTEAVIECELSPLQRRLYRGIVEAARRDVLAKLDEEGGEATTLHVLEALTRLRQVCAHPGLLMPEALEDPEASGKFEAFGETVEEILDGGHKVLVFSAFASMLKIMRRSLDRREIAYGYLDGSTKDRDRQVEVERFMADQGPPVFLCSLKAGGVGLTLTAADYVILYDPWWNPAVERQAIDRTHRIGQTRPVTAYRMVTAGTVEEKIRALAERKSALSRAVIKADSAVAKTLTREDLAFLFSDPE